MSGNHVAAGRLAARMFHKWDVEQIRQRAWMGEAISALAREHDAHIHTIRNMVYGRTYRDYGGPIREPRS
jgi:hypothetical protein